VKRGPRCDAEREFSHRCAANELDHTQTSSVTETLTTLNPKSSAAQVTTPKTIVDLVGKLLDHHIYEEIADLLNKRGYATRLSGSRMRAARTRRGARARVRGPRLRASPRGGLAHDHDDAGPAPRGDFARSPPASSGSAMPLPARRLRTI